MFARKTNLPVRRRTLRRGFTLIEVLLVLAILGVIAAMVVPNLLGRQDRALIQETRIAIHNAEQGLQLYKVDHFSYPATLEELAVRQEINGQMYEPYLDKEPKDAWGTPLNYNAAGTHHTQTGKPDVWSAGPNRKDDQGAGDDINNWSESTTSQ